MYRIVKKIIKKTIYIIKDAREFIYTKLIYPMIKKIIFIIGNKKFTKKSDLVLSCKIWCKWSVPDWKIFFPFVSLIKLIDKNS